MSRRPKARTSKDLGLSVGLAAGRYFLGMEELHFGWWPDDLPVKKENLARAQTAYDDLLLEHLPESARSVLEVGCGSGRLAQRLLASGRRVDVVSPSSYLTSVARQKLGDDAGFFECRFEDLETDRRWDLVLFAESFQYLEPGVGLTKAPRLLEPGGHLLICDYHRLPVEGRCPIGGGRPWPNVEAELEACPLELVLDLDITERVSRGFAVLQDMDVNLLKPSYEAVLSTLQARHPWTLKLLRRLFARKLRRLEDGVLTGGRSPEAFRRFKTYRLMLLRAAP